MDAQELRNLQEAYMEVVENQQLDEEITPARRRQYKAGLKVRQANQEAAPGKARPKKRPTPPTQHPSMRTGLTQDMRDTIRDNSREENPDKPEGPGGITKNPRKLAQQKARGQHAEQADLYDIILSHLLDEGYADTQQAAEAIMVNMSEEWRESICEELTGERREH